MRPINHLFTAARMYPHAWRLVDDFRAGRGRDLPRWPGWCFLPISGWYAIVSADSGGTAVPRDRGADIGRLAAIGTWRYTQGIYRFDPDVFHALWTTRMGGDLPGEVLLRLPQWCVYIETPGRQFGDVALHGFWCHLEWDANDGRRELRLLLDTDKTLQPVPIHLGDWPLSEAIGRAINEATRHIPMGTLAVVPGRDDMDQAAAVLSPLVSLVLYLCSDQPDFGPDARPQRPRPTRTKRGWRLFAPPGPTIWRIGDMIGRQIRSAVESGATDTGRSVSPHIRRAHWHGYWTGPRKGQQRFVYRWLPPIPVGID